MGDEGRDERRRWEREVRVENFRSLHLWCSGRGGWRVGLVGFQISGGDDDGVGPSLYMYFNL
jgi:hypothetical protein